MSTILNSLTLDPTQYQNQSPYPQGFQDEFLEPTFAKRLQEEILSIPSSEWDRQENPFESKQTLRNKQNFPPLLTQLFDQLQTKAFVAKLSEIVGEKLLLDPTRNFWGVHTQKPGDKLDIHVDAGLHPTTKQKKQVTLGIYLSSNWCEEQGCHLEVWRGESAKENSAKLLERVAAISPNFNRFVLFTCNDYAWHGNPEPVDSPDAARRIFVTISYLSENQADENKRVKAFFVKRPQDPEDAEKDKLRLLRADPEKQSEIYRTG